MDLVCSGAVILLFVFFVGLGQRSDWNLSTLFFGFLDEWSLYVAEDKVEWAFLVCDSSVLCNPLESKGVSVRITKRGLTPSLTL